MLHEAEASTWLDIVGADSTLRVSVTVSVSVTMLCCKTAFMQALTGLHSGYDLTV